MDLHTDLHKEEHKINNFWVFFTLISLSSLMVIFLFTNFIIALFFPSKMFENLDFGNKASCYFAYFTTQTNYLVVFYFLFHLFKVRTINANPGLPVRLAITVYITITMFIFWTGYFAGDAPEFNEIISWDNITANPLGVYRFISTIILHFFIPIFMIISFLFVAGEEEVSFQQHNRFWLWIIAAYPILYAICILIRGEIRFSDHPNDPKTWYPYFFLNFHSTDEFLGFTAFFVGGFIIFGLSFGLQYLYLYLNNVLFRHYSNLEKQEQLERIIIKTEVKMQPNEELKAITDNIMKHGVKIQLKKRKNRGA